MNLIMKRSHIRKSQPSAVLQTYGQPRFRADGPVLALALATDGAVWAVEEPGTLACWSAEGILQGRRPLADLLELWVFAPGARWLAGASDDLLIWDMADVGQPLALPQPCWVTALAFHPHRPLVAVGHDDGSIELWDILQHDRVATYHPHRLGVSALAFSPDGWTLASAGEDRVIQLWDFAALRGRGTLTGHTDRIPSLTWHPSGRLLVSAGWDTTARVWDISTRDPLMLLNAHADQVNLVAFANDCGVLAVADSESDVHLWSDPVNAAGHRVLHGHEGEVQALAFSLDGRTLATAGTDRVIRLWDACEGRPLTDGSRGRHGVSAGGALLASSDGGLGVSLWEADSGDAIPVVGGPGTVTTIALSPDGRSLAAGDPAGLIYVWPTAQTEQPPRIFDGQHARVGDLCFSPDGSLLAAASPDQGVVWVWNVVTGEPALLILEAADGASIEAVAFHPNGRWLACGGVDWLSTGGSDGAVGVWDVIEQRRIALLDNSATALAFDPGTARLIVAGLDRCLTAWDLATEEVVYHVGGHAETVRGVAVSAKGTSIASAGDDRLLRLWQAATGAPLATHHLDSPVMGVAFAPDGRSVYTANGNATIHRITVAVP